MRGSDGLPFAVAVEHFPSEFADVAGAFGISVEIAGNDGMLKRFLDAEEDGLDRE